jgi:pyruvate dehydrogenase E2 component (dihydrolipoamide acetyltransferase)
MVQGTVNDWSVAEGTEVEKGDELVEIETDKIANVLEAPTGGVLRRIVAQPGEVLPVSALLGVITEGDVSEAELDAFISEQQAALAEMAAAESDPLSESRVFHWEGLNIRYLDSENGDHPLICLHGFGGDKDNWQFNLGALAPSRRVIAPDFPSHGDSSVNAEYSTQAAYARLVIALMDHLQIEKAELTGHSMGGAIALLVTRDAPARVASLSLMAPAGVGSSINVEYVDGFAKANSRNELKKLAAMLFADKEMVSRQMIAELLKYKRLDGVEAALSALAADMHEHGQMKLQLQDVTASVPTTVFWGAQDEILPVQNADTLPANVTVVRPACGHMVHMEAAEAVNAHLGR